MNQNEKNISTEKVIKIVYTRYEELPDGNVRCRDRVGIVPFSKNTTEYVEKMSYHANMEAMMLDIFENGFVFLDDSFAVNVLNIKQFMSCEHKYERWKKEEISEEKKIVPTREYKKKNRYERWKNKKNVWPANAPITPIVSGDSQAEQTKKAEDVVEKIEKKEMLEGTGSIEYKVDYLECSTLNGNDENKPNPQIL